MQITPHFTAQLTFLPDKNGEMLTPASSGFRAAIKFDFAQELIIGIQNYAETEFVFAGDTVLAEITLLSADTIVRNVYEGLSFEFYEQGQLRGTGIVTKMLR